MRKIKEIFRFIIAFAIIIAVLIIIQLFKKGNNIIESQFNSKKFIMKLPKFDSMDVRGKLVKSENFKGKNLYVQFVDPLDFDDIDLIKKIYVNWKDENLEIVVITKDFERFKARSGIGTEDIIVLANDYEKLKSKFNSPQCCGTYYLFNKSGRVIAAGKNVIGYENGVKVFLKQLIRNEYFSMSNFIRANENIKNIEWFDQIAEIIEKEDKRYFIFSLFTSFCESCLSGAIINNLKKIYSKNKNFIYVMCILNADFHTKEDIESLRSQSGINFPIVIADSLLNQKWVSLIHEFREADLTDIVFIVDKTGKILKVYHRNCNCYKSFFDFVNSLI
ncbi:hypothetical protein NLC26_01600 [Candidatus Aminicenantes bacterium AC-708-M15]|nr:hypothetical protein [SCandidatus Aminicenantes bacterium Aminicenantia_JdfR_composite]MCP2604156.1 hypothetical protein [Candidatus Aminicenantes bacterium AC-708-M15]MCP2617937.1 hypothetical protein [Candidatus Aminicenantes bacterium AC-335-A11]